MHILCLYVHVSLVSQCPIGLILFQQWRDGLIQLKSIFTQIYAKSICT